MTSESFNVGKSKRRQRLAIIGCGSSGLICLKSALDLLPSAEWEIVCFEKSERITGCWGNPYPGFVSTSTKYTTQFACFPLSDACVKDDAGRSRDEFFCGGDYGEYLEQFAEHFHLSPHIQLNSQVQYLRPITGGWELSLQRRAKEIESSDANRDTQIEQFDVVIICTGLASRPKPIPSDVPVLSMAELSKPTGLGHLRNRRIVVIGGGESAVDYAHRLSQPELDNTVYLSLLSGVRVSPRYHPIRGVPSDFLRNRLMLSIHEDLRNWIGQGFVEARIKYQEQFEHFFPANSSAKKGPAKESPVSIDPNAASVAELRKAWAFKLTKAAKDDLFNMFHNKSDDFLDDVARGRIHIVGPPSDTGCERFRAFESDEQLELRPDLIVPAIGYRSELESLSAGTIRLQDFYLGCCHIQFENLFLVGFARPIIGNIPTISEMQAQYVCGLIAGKWQRDSNIAAKHAADQDYNRQRFAKLNLDAIYPVEMFPYCDRLAKRMHCYPSLFALRSVVSWCRLQLAPATTMHYFFRDAKILRKFDSAPVYMPLLLVSLLLLLKPVDAIYRLSRVLRRKQ